MKEITIKRIYSCYAGTAWFVVLHGENEIGTIRKMAEDRYTRTPWQAFRGIGEASTLAGSFYGRNGKAQAIAAVAGNLMDHQQRVRRLNRRTDA